MISGRTEGDSLIGLMISSRAEADSLIFNHSHWLNIFNMSVLLFLLTVYQGG